MTATVRVPATSANLGPGFDSFGLALAVYDQVSGELTDSGLELEVVGVCADTVPRTAEHLVARAVRRAFEAAGKELPGLRLQCRNRIPHGGGQGSSAAAIVGGLLLGRELADARGVLSDADILALACAMEGHPDNVAPALIGGFTIAVRRPDGSPLVVRREVHSDIRAVVFSAHRSSSTKLARALLPPTVPHAAAAANAAAAALLVHALTCDPSHLLQATRDWLHQSYRAAAMPESAALVDEMRQAGIAAVISGAGPSVLALTTEPLEPARWSRPGFDAHAVEIDRAGAQVSVG